MNLTDKEKCIFKATLEGILKDLHTYSPFQQDQVSLNNRKYTYSYTQCQGKLYVTLYCKGVKAYYFYVESDLESYIVRGWSYLRGKPDSQTMFTLFLDNSNLYFSEKDVEIILNSISSKERFTNLYIALCLVSQNDTFVKWGCFKIRFDWYFDL